MNSEAWRRFSRAAWLLAALATFPLALPAIAGAPRREPIRDLRAENASSEDAVFVILFSLPDCTYCDSVRNAYLPGIEKDERFRARVRVREVVMDSERALIDLRGGRTTHAEFAPSQGVRFAPTVLFLDGSGRSLAEPLVGGDVSGFYGSYLDERMSQALASVDSSEARGRPPPSNRR